MTGLELFVWALVVLGWIVFQVVRRVRKPPRPLGRIEEEGPAAPAPVEPPSRASPLDVEWGRAPEPVPRPGPEPYRSAPAPSRAPPLPAAARVPASQPEAWGADHVHGELALARQLAARQAERMRRQSLEALPRRHPRRPRLRAPGALRDAVVLTAILGPCRGLEGYRPPDSLP